MTDLDKLYQACKNGELVNSKILIDKCVTYDINIDWECLIYLAYTSKNEELLQFILDISGYQFDY